MDDKNELLSLKIEYMKQSLLHQMLAMHAQTAPSKPAVIMRDQTITYSQLYQSAVHLASHLQQSGLQGEVIALHMPNSIALAITYLGCYIAGAIALPLNVTLKKPEIEYIFEKTLPKWLFTCDSTLQEIDVVKTGMEHILTTSSPAFHQLLETPATAQEKFQARSVDAQAPFAIFYTSGSTGKPKGVVHSRASFAAMVENMTDAFELTAEDRLLVCESMSNASGSTQSFLPLFVGGTTLLLSDFNVSEFLQAIRHRPTRMTLMGKSNFDIIKDPTLNQTHFAGIQFNLTGGDKVTKDLMISFREKTGIPLRMGYGMSEFLLLMVNKSDDSEKMTSIGQASKNVEIQLLDSQGKRVARGDVGEVWVRGPNCMLGYWKDPEATAAAFQGEWLRTGDLASQDAEGFYWFVGRLKHMIVRQGDNVSPLEIEEALALHPAIHAVGVIGIPDAIEGQVPIAYVELNAGMHVTQEELLLFAKSQLEDYKVPVSITILDTLPRTRSGKIAREALNQVNSN